MFNYIYYCKFPRRVLLLPLLAILPSDFKAPIGKQGIVAVVAEHNIVFLYHHYKGQIMIILLEILKANLRNLISSYLLACQLIFLYVFSFGQKESEIYPTPPIFSFLIKFFACPKIIESVSRGFLSVKTRYLTRRPLWILAQRSHSSGNIRGDAIKNIEIKVSAMVL